MKKVKICKRCNNKFDAYPITDNKIINLSKRVYCYDCSPFKSRKAQDYRLDRVDYINRIKKCPKCKIQKSLDDFYIRKNRIASSYCKKCSSNQPRKFHNMPPEEIQKTRKYVIYKIENTINNKVYIGSTCDFNRRYKTHFNHLRLNKHCNIHLQRSYNIYGVRYFVMSIIEDNIPSNIITSKEDYYIQKYDSYKNGYNGSQFSSFRDYTKLSTNQHKNKKPLVSYNIIDGTIEKFTSFADAKKVGHISQILQKKRLCGYGRLWFLESEFSIETFRKKYQEYVNKKERKSRKTKIKIKNIDKKNKLKRLIRYNEQEIISYCLDTGDLEYFTYASEPSKKYKYSKSYYQCLRANGKTSYNKLWFYKNEFNLNIFIKKYKNTLTHKKSGEWKKTKGQYETLAKEFILCATCNKKIHKYNLEKGKDGRFRFRKSYIRQYCSKTCSARKTCKISH